MKKRLFLLAGAVIALFFTFIVVKHFSIEGTKTPESIVSYGEPLSQDNEINTIVLKIAYSFPEYTPQHRALLEKFVPMIQDGSGRKILVEVYPNKQLGSEEDYTQGVRIGTIEMCIGGKSLGQLLLGLKTLNYPYLFDSYSQANKLLNGAIGQRISEGVDSLGVRCLAWNLNGFSRISTLNDVPANEISKRNLKIAAMSYDKDTNILNAMGFLPVYTDIYKMPSLLKQRIVDGYDSTLLTSYYNGLYKDQKSIFMTNHIIDTDMYLINNKFWNSLSEEHRKLIENASKESANYEAELLIDYEKDIINIFEEKGIKIKYPDIQKSIPSVYRVENVEDKYILQMINEIKAAKIEN